MRRRSSRPTSHCFSGIVLILKRRLTFDSLKSSTPTISTGARIDAAYTGSLSIDSAVFCTIAMMRSVSSA